MLDLKPCFKKLKYSSQCALNRVRKTEGGDGDEAGDSDSDLISIT